MKIGIVLLAAGKSERFGSNKLLADFAGKPMICRALETMHALEAARKCVVAGSEEIAALAGAYGFDVIINREPELGQAHSIALGVGAMREMDAVLLMVADQPLLRAASLEGLVSAFAASGRGIACLRDRTHRGNPAVFAARYMPKLLAISGDRGAKGILRAHEDDLLVVDCLGGDELSDADTPQTLALLQEKE